MQQLEVVPKLRPATGADYPTFKRLYARAHAHEPPLSPDVFQELIPRVLVAESADGVQGGVLVHRGALARLAMVAVSEEAEGCGVATRMMLALAGRLRTEGTRRWSLSVKRTNVRALRLYARLGLREVSSCGYWELSRWTLCQLDASAMSLRIRPVEVTEHRKLERTFGLRPHQLANEHQLGARIRVAERGGRPVGVASLCHDPDPLILATSSLAAAIRPLLSELWPDEPKVPIRSSSPAVKEALSGVGAPLLFETVELEGPLPGSQPGGGAARV